MEMKGSGHLGNKEEALALAARRAPLGHVLLLVTLFLTLVPALGWIAWLLAALPGEAAEHLPRTASLVSLKLGKLVALPTWAAVGGLNVAAMFLRVGARRRTPLWLHAIPGFLLVAGLLIVYPALGQTDTAGDQRWAELVAACYLAAAALVTAGVIFWLMWGRPGGVELAHLFVAAAVEWLLVFVSADVLLRFHYLDKTAIPPAARFRLFEIGQLGALANLVFAIGLRTWPGLFGVVKLRIRAWLLTMALYNAGLILVLTGVQALCVTGGVLMFAGVVFFGVGLGGLRGRAGGPHAAGRRTVRVGMVWLLGGIGMLMVFCAVRGPFPGLGYDPFGQAIEHAVVAGFFGTIVLGMAQRLVVAYLPGTLTSRRLLTATAWAFGVATVVREVLAISAIGEVGSALGVDAGSEAGMQYGMSACAVVQCAAMAALTLAVLRAVVAARRRGGAASEKLAESAGIAEAEAARWSVPAVALLLGRAPEDLAGAGGEAK
jgi:hypothetical protein